jgi:hypothetical protein
MSACKDCKIDFGFKIGEEFIRLDQIINKREELAELAEDLEKTIPIILDAFEYWLYKNYGILLKAKSPYFRLLLQILRQQNDMSLFLYEKYRKHVK